MQNWICVPPSEKSAVRTDDICEHHRLSSNFTTFGGICFLREDLRYTIVYQLFERIWKDDQAFMEFGVSTLDSISVLKLKDPQISMQLRKVQNRYNNHWKPGCLQDNRLSFTIPDFCMENVTFVEKVTKNCLTQRRGIHYSFWFDVWTHFWSWLFGCSHAWHLFHFTIELISFFPHLSPILLRYIRYIPIAIPSIPHGHFNEFTSLDSTLKWQRSGRRQASLPYRFFSDSIFHLAFIFAKTNIIP
jgi:hypothetical protein